MDRKTVLLFSACAFALVTTGCSNIISPSISFEASSTVYELMSESLIYLQNIDAYDAANLLSPIKEWFGDNIYYPRLIREAELHRPTMQPNP